jgi:hypothetical protein
MKPLMPIAAFAVILSACAQTPMGPVEPTSPAPYAYAPPPAVAFRARDFAWSTLPGAASIAGALTYRDGPIRYACAGEEVILTPETPWTRRRMLILYGSAYSAAVPVAMVRSRMPSAQSEDYLRYVHRVKCDADSRFSFGDLPNGSWFVITLAKPVGPRGDTVAVMRRVETHGGRRFVSLN